MKDIIFLGDSAKQIAKFPEPAKQLTLLELKAAQQGIEPLHWRPMPVIGSGVIELKIRSKSSQFRVLYVAKFKDAIYVLHGFQKKTQKTAKRDIDLGKKRYKQIPGAKP